MNIIAYPNNDTISIGIPATKDISIHTIAKKIVPKGVPYMVISQADLPEDRMFRNAWSMSFSNPDGYGEAL